MLKVILWMHGTVMCPCEQFLLPNLFTYMSKTFISDILYSRLTIYKPTLKIYQLNIIFFTY